MPSLLYCFSLICFYIIFQFFIFCTFLNLQHPSLLLSSTCSLKLLAFFSLFLSFFFLHYLASLVLHFLSDRHDLFPDFSPLSPLSFFFLSFLFTLSKFLPSFPSSCHSSLLILCSRLSPLRYSAPSLFLFLCLVTHVGPCHPFPVHSPPSHTFPFLTGAWLPLTSLFTYSCYLSCLLISTHFRCPSVSFFFLAPFRPSPFSTLFILPHYYSSPHLFIHLPVFPSSIFSSLISASSSSSYSSSSTKDHFYLLLFLSLVFSPFFFTVFPLLSIPSSLVLSLPPLLPVLPLCLPCSSPQLKLSPLFPSSLVSPQPRSLSSPLPLATPS